jgi:hypothetical protein
MIGHSLLNTNERTTSTKFQFFSRLNEATVASTVPVGRSIFTELRCTAVAGIEILYVGEGEGVLCSLRSLRSLECGVDAGRVMIRTRARTVASKSLRVRRAPVRRRAFVSDAVPATVHVCVSPRRRSRSRSRSSSQVWNLMHGSCQGEQPQWPCLVSKKNI